MKQNEVIVCFKKRNLNYNKLIVNLDFVYHCFLGMLDSVKRFFGLIKTPTQLVDRMLFEIRRIDGEEESDKPRKVYDIAQYFIIDFTSIYSNERLFAWNGKYNAF